ncbi:MAG: bifunctional oligoribonuclease/PAP phosphatase NrnA [Calditrichaeota bacterium]|nr:bifunctional oligoribonuclease/PAP phosphatase NrnA [Calditrichota bacterium]
MTTKRNWDAITNFLENKKRLLITTHAHPDGDAPLGSQIALAGFLRKIGKEAVLINCDIIPKFFQFLDENNEIQTYAGKEHDDLIRSTDGAIIVDISDWARLRKVGEAIRRFNLPVACIDHHIPSDDMGKAVVSDQTASSTGELLYDLIVNSPVEMDQQIVNALYTCILTDTGSFRFSNTTPTTHQVTADLLRRGAEFRKIYERVYETNSKNRSILMGNLLANLHFECNDRLVWFVLTQELLQKTGAELWETEGFSELPRSIEGVEVSLMFTETKDGKAKISFRSKGRIAINGLANKFGGGGHKFASGAATTMDLQEALHTVLEEAKNLVNNSI